MYCFQDNYTYYISFDGGSAYNLLTIYDPVKLTYDRENNQRFVRCKSSEWKIYRRGNVGSYDALLAAVNAPDSAPEDVRVKIITEYLTYNTHTWRVINEYEGHVNLTGMQVDEDSGTIKFTPDTIDEYKFWDDHKDDKVNVKETDEWVIEYQQTPTAFDLFFEGIDLTYLYLQSFSAAGSPAYPPPAWAPNTDYVQDTAYSNGWCTYSGQSYYCNTTHTSGAAFDASKWSIPSGGYVTSRQLRIDAPTTGYAAGMGDYQPGFPDAMTAVPSGDTYTNCPAGTYYKASMITGATLTTTVTTHGRKFLDVIQKVVEAWDDTLTVTSDFFTNATNPITGTTNRVDNIMFGSNRYIKAWPFENEETDVLEEISLKDINEMLRIMFNCYWHVSGGSFIIEHIKYYENDRSYTPYTPSDVLDLTDATDFPVKDMVLADINGDSNFNKYAFVTTDIPKTESLCLSMGGRQYDGFIRYASPLAKKSEEKHDLANFVVDLEWSYDFNDEFPDEGWMLMACDSLNHVMFRNASMGVPRNTYDEMVVLSNRLNGDLWWSNLMDYFHQYGRYFQVGSLNNDDYTFQSTKEFKKQIDLKFPRYFYFNHNLHVTTNLGSGLIQTMEVELKKNTVTMTVYFTAPKPVP